MNSYKSKAYSKNILGIIWGGVILLSIFIAQPAQAEFDNIFFFINGDSTVSTMTQGDELVWGTNCDSGATINWTIWYDANSNSLVDPTVDVLLTSENMTDGSLISETNPITDGYVIFFPIKLSIEPGNYIFRATDIALDSSIQKIASVTAMSSPQSILSGQVSIPGITPPNALLQNIFIFGESESGDGGVLGAVTDINGNYSVNVDIEGSGEEFFLEAGSIQGYITPEYNSAIATGNVPDLNFTYIVPVDSVWGFVKDQDGVLLNHETDVSAYNYNDVDRYTTTRNSRYAIYFTESDKGDWTIGSDSRNSPFYLTENNFDFSHDTLTSFQYDITLTKTDTVIYIMITENGLLASNNYRIDASSDFLNMYAETVFGYGVDHPVPLAVSTLDNSGWSVGINQYDDDFQIPFGLIPEVSYFNNVSPGDTITFNLITGNIVSGSIIQDAGDTPVLLSDVYISAWDGFNGYNNQVNGDGNYTLFTGTGLYSLGAYLDGYIFNPSWRYVNVTGDTVGTGLNFEMNQAHCNVSGTLSNVSLPLDASYYMVVALTGTNENDGYFVTAQVDSVTGTYTMNLSDGDWTIIPPCCFPDVEVPESTIITIGEAPDNSRTVDFEYIGLGCCTGFRGNTDGDVLDVIDINDLVYLVEFQFNSGPPVPCFDEGNVDAIDVIDIADIVYMVEFQFGGGPLPPDCPEY